MRQVYRCDPKPGAWLEVSRDDDSGQLVVTVATMCQPETVRLPAEEAERLTVRLIQARVEGWR